MIFKQLRLANWRQFSLVDIEFHPRLTILTGSNGAGKSTILNILSQNIGQHRPYLGVPIRRNGERLFSSSIFSIPNQVWSWITKKRDPNWSNIGDLVYGDGHHTPINVPTQGQTAYSLHFPNPQSVPGFHMPSHRILPVYQAIGNISFGGIPPESAFHRLIAETNQYYGGGGGTGYSLLFRLKELLANWAVFGEGNQTIGQSASQESAFKEFNAILRRILPKDIGFHGLRVDAPDIVVSTETGEFLVDALSGGLTAVIEMAALIYTRSMMPDVKSGRYVVTIDEPENHLHPAMQRTILPLLVDAFPNVQFIVATHSPFIVASRSDSIIYALKYETVEVREEEWETGVERPEVVVRPHKSRRVECIRLDNANLAASPSEILRDVLGVPVTFPLWVEDRLEQLVDRYRQRSFSSDTLADLRRDVEAAGLTEMFPDAVLNLGRTN